MTDIYAPIVPYVGAGGFRLNSTRGEVEAKLAGSKFSCEQVDDWVRYTDKETIELSVSKTDDRLFAITTLPGYKGKLFDTIGTDTTEEEFLRLEPSFVYNDFKETYESPKGVIIETDVLKRTASWISVFIKELTS